jgi:hypothetical protein
MKLFFGLGLIMAGPFAVSGNASAISLQELLDQQEVVTISPVLVNGLEIEVNLGSTAWEWSAAPLDTTASWPKTSTSKVSFGQDIVGY